MDESRYLPNYGGRLRPKDDYIDECEDEVEEDEEQQEGEAADSEVNIAIQQNGDDVNNDDDDDDDDDDEEDDDDDGENGIKNDSFRHPKKRKLKSLLSSFEFAPRVPPPPSPQKTVKSSFGGRNTLTDWSEHETFVLLEAWGERFLKRGRKSLRSEEWQEVAEKVSNESKIERTDTQCRNRLDTLKKKYKKEKPLLESNKLANTKWVYFKKMDMLMSSTPQQAGLSCGVDSGEYVFMNPTVYLDRANGFDEMRDSPGNTDSQEGDDDDSDLLPFKRSKTNGGSFRLLADSINKFSEIYEKIENGKRKQMVELEKMRMDFHKELELQKRQILDRARDEIAKIRQGDYEENDSAENISG